jgi:hypothetical protein
MRETLTQCLLSSVLLASASLSREWVTILVLKSSMLCRSGTESLLVIQGVIPTSFVEIIPLMNNFIIVCKLERCVQGRHATHHHYLRTSI